MRRTLILTFAGLVLSASLAACGPPTLQGAESRFKSNKDKLSAIITRKPQAKAEITAKITEFQAEFDKAMQEPSEEKKIAAISSLNARIDRYIDDVEPRESKAGGPSDKLDEGAPPAPTPAPGPAPTPGNKLDAPAPSGGMGGGAEGASGMGGAPAPAPAAAPAPANGGMGGM